MFIVLLIDTRLIFRHIFVIYSPIIICLLRGKKRKRWIWVGIVEQFAASKFNLDAHNWWTKWAGLCGQLTVTLNVGSAFSICTSIWRFKGRFIMALARLAGHLSGRLYSSCFIFKHS